MANLYLCRKKAEGGIQVSNLAVTTLPTKIAYIVGDNLNLSGMVVTATYTDGVTADVTSVITTSPTNGSVLSTTGTIPVTVTYQGVTTSFNIICEDVPADLNDASWELIQRLVQTGTLKYYYSEGDTKNITINGNTIKLHLARINDGTGSASSYYPNYTADFISDVAGQLAYNSNGENNWTSSTIRTYLNNTLYGDLPSDLKNVIINKTHYYMMGDNSQTMSRSTDKLWIPTKWEIFGDTQYSDGERAIDNIQYNNISWVEGCWSSTAKSDTTNANWVDRKSVV